MTKNNTQILRLLFSMFSLFLIGITFGSCQAEKDFKENSAKGFIIKRCSMKDVNLERNFKLNEAVNYVKRLQTKSLQENANARIVFDEKSGLYYDDEKGIYVSKDEKESYNFPIIQTDITEKVKNITFNKNANNEYDIYIVHYDFTKEDVKNYSKEALAEREIKYQALLKNGVEYPVEAQNIICVNAPTIQYEADGTYVTIDGNDYDVYCGFVTSTLECYYVGGGGPPTNGTDPNNGNGTQGGGTGEPTTNPDNPRSSILTAAVIDRENTPNPCAELKSKTLQSAFKYRFNTLNNPAHFNLDHETAFVETRNGNTQGFTYLDSPPGENNHIDFATVPNCASFMHVHNDDYPVIDSNGQDAIRKTAKIPSAADLISFILIQRYARNVGMPAGETYGMTLSSQAIFSFKLKTEYNQEFTYATNSTGIDWKKFKEDSDLLTQRILDNSYLSDPQKLVAMQKLLLKMIKDAGLSSFIGLYQGAVTGSGATTTIKWAEKILNDTNELKEIPCN